MWCENADQEAPSISVYDIKQDILTWPGGSLDIHCQSNEPIEWRFVGVSYTRFLYCYLFLVLGLSKFKQHFSLQYDKMTIKTQKILIEGNERPYKNTLMLEALTFLNVGFYYCVKESAMTKEFIGKLENCWEEVSTKHCVPKIRFFLISNSFLVNIEYFRCNYCVQAREEIHLTFNRFIDEKKATRRYLFIEGVF